MDVFRPYMWLNPETGKQQPCKGVSYTLNGQSRSLKELIEKAELWDQGRRAQKNQTDNDVPQTQQPDTKVPETQAA